MGGAARQGEMQDRNCLQSFEKGPQTPDEAFPHPIVDAPKGAHCRHRLKIHNSHRIKRRVLLQMYRSFDVAGFVSAKMYILALCFKLPAKGSMTGPDDTRDFAMHSIAIHAAE